MVVVSELLFLVQLVAAVQTLAVFSIEPPAMQRVLVATVVRVALTLDTEDELVASAWESSGAVVLAPLISIVVRPENVVVGCV